MDFIIISTIIVGVLSTSSSGANTNFHQNYDYLWGTDHFWVNPQGTEVQLKLDKSSGAGFISKSSFGSGLFHIRMKIPEKKTGGVVTNFYLTSGAPNGKDPGNHFELNYEFLGTNGTVETNIYDNDHGHREQNFKLWFDPSQDFHSYDILWNTHQIVFFVDQIPIRMFKNNTAKGLAYPTMSMHVEATIWNAEWAGVVDWSQAPFISHYQDFSMNACSAPAQSSNISHCANPQYFWNKPEYFELNAQQKQAMESYRKSYMVYDYCSSPATRKPECFLN